MSLCQVFIVSHSIYCIYCISYMSRWSCGRIIYFARVLFHLYSCATFKENSVCLFHKNSKLYEKNDQAQSTQWFLPGQCPTSLGLCGSQMIKVGAVFSPRLVSATTIWGLSALRKSRSRERIVAPKRPTPLPWDMLAHISPSKCYSPLKSTAFALSLLRTALQNR